MFALALLACAAKGPSTDSQPTGDSGPGERPSPPPTFVEAPARLVGMGDFHGDLSAAREALRLAGAIDEDDAWIGGDLVVVQTGDQLDRGDEERAILELLESLSDQAHAAGGALYPLLGNHEVMNVELDLRYVTEGGFADFADVPWDDTDPLYEDYEESQRGRVAAFRPGGAYASLLAGHNVVMVVGDTAFVHGGILPDHVDYGLERINSETQAWMRGEGEEPEILGDGTEAPIWSRHYSDGPDEDDCALLEEALAAIPAARMVVGHTVQLDVNPACDDRVWRVDVGMAEYYGGAPAALLIEGEALTVLE